MAFFPDKVTVNRPSNNNEFLQINFSEINFKVSIFFEIKRKKKCQNTF